MDGRLVSAEKIVSALRERKTAAEIADIKDAIRRDARDLRESRRSSSPRAGPRTKSRPLCRPRSSGKSSQPAWDQATCPAVFSGPETAGAHYTPTDRRVERGHVLNMDFGVKVNGYCSDLQRTFYILGEGEDERAGRRAARVRDDRPGGGSGPAGDEARASRASTSTRSPGRSSPKPATKNSPTPSATRSAGSPTTARPSSARTGRNMPTSRSSASRRAWSSRSSRA